MVLWFAPLALYALKNARNNTYGDMSESMFQSLRHPSVGIESARWEETCKVLLRFIWNNRSYLFDPIQTRITLGGTFEPPVRWLNRSSINTALNKHVVDVSAGADEEAVGGQEDFVEDEEEQDVSALGPRAAEWIIYIKAIWVIDQVGLQVGLRALNDRVRMNFMCEKPTKAII